MSLPESNLTNSTLTGGVYIVVKAGSLVEVPVPNEDGEGHTNKVFRLLTDLDVLVEGETFEAQG